MREIDIQKTQFTVSDFLSWQKDGTLNLRPVFQRRAVWKPGAKSYFIDTVVRGLPAPIIYLRQRIDLGSQKTSREVIDGQQRLRTIFAYVSPESLGDYKAPRDTFQVQAVHNADIAGQRFDALSERHQTRILSYQFSTHVLPSSVEDRDVLEMFARLNATGDKLNHQELRNAGYFGALKTLMYELAREQLDRWVSWRVFNDSQIARMKEVELTSDLTINMMHGLTGKNQHRLNDFYRDHDMRLPEQPEIRKRFRYTMDQIDTHLGSDLPHTVYSSEVYFFTLFTFIYDRLYGLGSPLVSASPPRPLTPAHRSALLVVSERLRDQSAPKDVLDAAHRAPVDIGRRRTRLNYLQSNVV